MKPVSNHDGVTNHCKRVVPHLPPGGSQRLRNGPADHWGYYNVLTDVKWSARHLRTTKFGERSGWQSCIKPGQLDEVTKGGGACAEGAPG